MRWTRTPILAMYDIVFSILPMTTRPRGGPQLQKKRSAFIADAPIDTWIKVWSNRMRAHASLTMIYRAQKLGEILQRSKAGLAALRCTRSGRAQMRRPVG